MGYAFGMLAVFAWLTHVFYCFGHALWLLLLTGAVFFPIGILHGIYIWFN